MKSLRMRKPLLMLLACALLLSLLSVSAAAEIAVDPDWSWIPSTPGSYACANGEDFSPVGEIKINWVPDAAQKTDMTDGDTADWKALGYEPVSITETNMVSWVGGQAGVRDPGMPEAWGVEACFVADPDYLYMIFDITDSNFTYGDPEQMYNGDAIQISIDFGGRLEDILRNDPASSLSAKGIFYSFSCEGDGAPVRIMRQESDQDGMLTEANGHGVKGATRRTETGWSAEIALSWQQLYDDYSWKAWEDPNIYFGGDQDLPLRVNMALTYLNRIETAGEITWAASATRGMALEDVPVLTWTPVDNGIHLKLTADDGVHINCDRIIVLDYNGCYPLPPETTAEEIDVPCTEPAWATEIATEPPATPWEPPVTYETEAETAAVEEPASEGLAPELNAILEKYGCSGTAGFSAIALLAAAAVAVALKKKD